jgi:cAMP-specific phosphodiesterase 4
VHDLGHPGRNNAFQVATESELALLYNDKSVLEMMHISKAFQLLKEPGNIHVENVGRKTKSK